MLTTLDRLKNHLGIPLAETGRDAKLEKILKGASAFFERQTGRSFGVQAHTERHDGDDTTELQLRQYPVTEDEDLLPAIKIDGVAVNVAAEIEAGDLAIDYCAGIVWRGAGFGAGFQNVEVTYTAGYVLPSDESGAEDQTLPDDVELAVLKLAGRAYERSTAEGAASANAGTISVQFAKDLDPEIRATIETHQKTIVM